MIKEVIVVEGKDDITKVKSALDCEVIATHGFGYGKKLINTLKSINKRRGIIIFTDPDYMGEKIRRDLTKNIPGAKQAYLPRHLSLKGTNVGVENAREEDIREALLNAKPLTEKYEEIFQMKDLYKYGLLGNEDSSYKREKLCQKLKIGHANGKILLKRLNSFKISLEELENALKEVEQSKDYLNRK